MITTTSRLAYASSNFEPKERLILQALKRGPMTRQELEIKTGLPINCVCGRVAHLLDIGTIEPCGVLINGVTGKQNGLVRIVKRRRAA